MCLENPLEHHKPSSVGDFSGNSEDYNANKNEISKFCAPEVQMGRRIVVETCVRNILITLQQKL
jgi:hypothetical protein